MQSTMMQVPLNVAHLLERGRLFFGSHEIVSRLPDKSLARTNFAAIHDRARRLAKALVAAGVKPGDAVGTFMWNSSWHLEAYFGIPVAGAVLHTINLRLSPQDIAYIVEDAGDRIILVDDVLLPLFEKVLPFTKVERIIVVPTSGAPVPDGYESYEDFIAEDASDYQYPQLDENAPCGMCYTSGTVGRPKGVVHSHRAVVLHALSVSLPDCLNLSCHDSVFVVTPMFHVNAWGVPFAAAMVGCSLQFPGQHMGAEDLLDIMESEKVTLALGVPTIWMSIRQTLDRQPDRWKLGHGTRMMVGGAAVNPALVGGLEAHGLSIKHGWGMTELTPVGTLSWLKPEHTSLPAEQQYEIRARQGLPIPLMELRIMGDDGVQPWDGQSVGELQVRGPIVTGGYHNQPTTEDKLTADGWFRTGDVASIDAEGYMRISDRTKDLIKSGGEWISSVDLENAIMGHPAVAEAAVIAVQHPRWDERPLAVVVKREGQKVTADDLRAFIAPRFAKWQLPDDFIFVDSLPHTSTGKFLKTALRQQFKDYVSSAP
ncbi:MAG: long-chain fatty acid--CoA ligase [Rhodospirillaceae bacterium]|nr:long-chain fatty acid--CoA ligase [Rhodospirillaceae bacterium]